MSKHYILTRDLVADLGITDANLSYYKNIYPNISALIVGKIGRSFTWRPDAADRIRDFVGPRRAQKWEKDKAARLKQMAAASKR